jgi:acyl-coenzyme A synthetase/AMP-(fatty) acid ligase
LALNDVKGMDMARVIEYYGNHPLSRDRTFLMYDDEDGDFRDVSFGHYLKMSLDYARLIDTLKRNRGRSREDRFHVGFYMQNTPRGTLCLWGMRLYQRHPGGHQ